MLLKTMLALIVFAMTFANTAISDERIKNIVRLTTDFSKPEKYERMSGGAATSRKHVNADAFSHSSANMKFDQEMSFKLGNALFRKLWVSSPASTLASDGLGPLFNARSCQRCHLKDGRGHPPPANTTDYDQASLLIRLSVPPRNDAEREAIASYKRDVIPEPTYGGQLQDFAIQGHAPEGKIRVTYENITIELGDGSSVVLRNPTYEISSFGYGPLDPATMISPRIAPQMIGLGLLEMIDEADLRAHADPEDKDQDGISGRIRTTWDNELSAPAVGRFGWKGGTPTVRQQSAGAFSGDVGISTELVPGHWGDCTENQAACRNAPSGETAQYEGVEAGKDVLDLVAHYSRNLAVPARRSEGDPTVLRGKELFYQSQCASCHMPKFVTRTDTDRPVHSRQLIWPYTDLLLHDMGPGLADNRPEGDANGQEWRTAPLWGIGLTETVSDHTQFLHDGRARNLTEAILWHGGEAEVAKEKFRFLDKADRDDLIAFLESL